MLALAGLTSQGGQMVRAAYLAMELTTWYVLIPLSLASLLTGLISSLGTTWGLFRLFATFVLLTYTRTIGYLADVAAVTTTPSADLRELERSPVLHAGAALLLLLVATVLAVYKPRGMTRYGQRKQHEQREPFPPSRVSIL